MIVSVSATTVHLVLDDGIISLTLGLLGGLGGSLCLLGLFGRLGLGGGLGDGSRGGGGLGLALLHRRIFGLLSHVRGSSGGGCLTLLKLSQLLLQLILTLLQSSNLNHENF